MKIVPGLDLRVGSANAKSHEINKKGGYKRTGYGYWTYLIAIN